MPATAYLKDSTVRAVAATDYFYFGSTANGHADSKALISTLFTSPTLSGTPVLGSATGTSLALSGAITAATVNGITLTSSTGTLTLTNGKTLSVTHSLTLAGTDGTTMTFPTTSATIARTDAANTFSGTQTFSGTIAGAAFTGTTMGLTGALTAMNATAIPAGGTAGSGLMFSSTANYGVFFGSGAPSLSAAKGSIYLRSDGSSTSTRLYVNSDGSTTWVAITTAS